MVLSTECALSSMPFRIDEAVQACIIQEQEVVHAVAILAKQGVVIILNVEKLMQVIILQLTGAVVSLPLVICDRTHECAPNGFV